MEIHFRSTAADQRVHFERSRSAALGHRFILLLGVCTVTGLLAGWGYWRLRESGTPDWQILEAFLIAGLFPLAYLTDLLWRRFGRVERWLQRFSGDYSLVLTAPGLALSGPDGHDFIPWSELLAFGDAGQHWLFHFATGRGMAVPKSALPDPAAQTQFAAEVRQSWREYGRNQGRKLPDTPPIWPLGNRAWSDLWANLVAGYRLAMARPVHAGEIRADLSQLLLLLLLQLATFLLADFLLADPGADFNGYGLTDFAATSGLYLLGGLAMVGGLAEPASRLRLLVAIAAAAWVAYAFYFLLYAAAQAVSTPWVDRIETMLYVLWVGWSLLIAFRTMVWLCGYPRPAALLPVALYALFNLVLAHGLPEEEFFRGPEEPGLTTTEGQPIDGEALIYRQAELIDRVTRDLAMERPALTDLYFVGFAGEADEQVFAHEIEYVKDLFDRRFGTAERSVALINHPDTTERWPLANAHNLEAVLRKIARRMNRKEDVLLLFLSSHGTSDHRLSVRFPTLPLNDLPASRLKEILDQTGIRHRIIIISACYSGGFLDALKDDHSLILTAASRDRPSFGCGTQSEFTYFSSALFVDGLGQTPSLVEAFEKAKTIIEAREHAEGKFPSQPQVHIGAAITPKLKSLEKRVGAGW